MLRGVEFLLTNPVGGLRAAPGVSKTAMALAALKVRKERWGTFQRALVVAPLRPCYMVWPKERDKWQDFHGLSMDVLHDENKNDDFLFASKADMLVINHDGLEWLLGAKRKARSAGINTRRLQKLGLCTLIIDELTYFASHDSYRFFMMQEALEFFQWRWGLTGSLGARGYEALWSQCFLLDGGAALGGFITHYRRKYFYIADPYNPHTYSLQPGTQRKIDKAIAPLFIQLNATGLPKVMEHRVEVQLPPKARKAYDEMWRNFITEVDSKTVIAANAAVKSGKCRQIASGGLYTTQRAPGQAREWTNLHTGKAEAVLELLEAMGGDQLMVAYDWEHDIDRIRRTVGKKWYWGKDIPLAGQSIKRDQELFSAWNRGDLPWLLAHPQSIGHGNNLQESSACHIAFHSYPWSWELYDQLIRRLRRRGTKAQRIFVHHIVTLNTLDDYQLSCLRGKMKTESEMYVALMEYARRFRKGETHGSDVRY
jgi:hypothetical protein